MANEYISKAEQVYKAIYLYIENTLAEYKNYWYTEKGLQAEYMTSDLYGVLIQRLGFDVDSENIVGDKTINFKFTLTSMQKKFADADFDKKQNVALFLDGIKEYITEKFETVKPEVPTGCEIEELNSIPSGIQTITDNSVTYKSDFEFIYILRKRG